MPATADTSASTTSAGEGDDGMGSGSFLPVLQRGNSSTNAEVTAAGEDYIERIKIN